MAKLTRAFQSLFGLNGNQSHFGQFGSRVSGPGVPSKDPATIQALSAFTDNGWLDAINAANKAPFLEDMNGLFYLLFYQICYMLQEGVPEWNAGTTYYVGSVVKKSGTVEQYSSTTDNNTGNALPTRTDNGNWRYLNPSNVSPGIIQDFGGSIVPVGYLLCDGTAYAQAAYPELYAAIGSNWDTFNGAVSPGVGNFRVPDIRGVVTIGAGQGNGLTNRTLAQFIGEETHTLVIGEIPSHNHPATTSPGTATVGTTTNTIVGSGPGNFLPSQNAQPLTVNIGNRGGDGAHNNMQPSAVVTKIIKT